MSRETPAVRSIVALKICHIVRVYSCCARTELVQIIILVWSHSAHNGHRLSVAVEIWYTRCSSWCQRKSCQVSLLLQAACRILKYLGGFSNR